jgi:hypothetical protein
MTKSLRENERVGGIMAFVPCSLGGISESFRSRKQQHRIISRMQVKGKSMLPLLHFLSASGMWHLLFLPTAQINISKCP